MHSADAKFFLARLTKDAVPRRAYVRHIHVRPNGSIAAVAYGTRAEALCFAGEEEAELTIARLAAHRVFGSYHHCVRRSDALRDGDSSAHGFAEENASLSDSDVAAI